jgi:alkanesulfonate monooxygenase SsuD/methylene tetrahydromethanopterin reductase-like flavin-dependent oxidoreductase (luciferase family)
MAAIGVHLPQLVERPTRAAVAEAVECAVAAERLGFDAVSVNDHIVYHGPWLDGPVLLAAAAARTTSIRLATTVLLPAVRGAAVTAQTLTALHLLSGGRLIAGLGAGSHRGDYDVCGLDFERRGAAFETAVGEVRARCPDGPPVWIGSWGAPAALRRVARLADGWVASAHAASPATFGERWARLQDILAAEGRDPDSFPNMVATLFFCIDDDPRAAADVVARRLAPALGREPDDVLAQSAHGTAEQVRERIAAYAEAGAQRIHLWPAADPLAQIEALAETALTRV